jgi:hypothetical protein
MCFYPKDVKKYIFKIGIKMFCSINNRSELTVFKNNDIVGVEAKNKRGRKTYD